MIDDDDIFGQINFNNPKPTVKGPRGRNVASHLQTITHEITDEKEYDDIEESGRDTKIVLPTKHPAHLVDGSKMIGDYKVEKTLG